MIMTREDLLETIEVIDKAAAWDSIEPKVYIKVCEALGLDYYDYDDPDKLFNDIKKAAKI